MLMMLAWFWASGTGPVPPPNLEKRGFGLARAPCEKLGPMMRAREGLMGCCGCFVASVFRQNPWFLRGFRAFRTTACCVPLDAVLEASRRAPREFEAILGGVGASGARPLKLAL